MALYYVFFASGCWNMSLSWFGIAFNCRLGHFPYLSFKGLNQVGECFSEDPGI